MEYDDDINDDDDDDSLKEPSESLRAIFVSVPIDNS
jgi:hypothetical protein